MLKKIRSGVIAVKRAWLSVLLVLALVCAGCGQTSSADDTQSVEIWLPVQDTEGVGAQAYVEALQEANPDMQYTYYNDEYYIMTVTEAERQEMLVYLTGSDNPFAEVIAASEYGDVFSDAAISADGASVIFTADRDAYMQDYVGAAYYAWYIGSTWAERVQAYELIPPEERSVSVTCVDEDGDVLMDTAGEGE